MGFSVRVETAALVFDFSTNISHNAMGECLNAYEAQWSGWSADCMYGTQTNYTGAVWTALAPGYNGVTVSLAGACGDRDNWHAFAAKSVATDEPYAWVAQVIAGALHWAVGHGGVVIFD